MAQTHSAFRFLLTSIALIISAQTVLSHPLQKRAGQSDFDWTSLTPSDNLTWVDCYTGTQCARFNVPLNYSDTNAGNAVLAMIRIPSTLAGSADYRGPVLFNPGGPGGSGVDFVNSAGSLVAKVIGPQFDLVSFDPRGVGLSTPNVSFFKTDIERAVFDFGPDSIDANASTDAIPRHWAEAQIIGQLAADRDTGILNHVTTDNVARDMLRIVQAHGQEKLQYWGISYGTVLGATFAAMFPDKVERLIIDGVLDMDAYYSTDWSDELHDSDKALQTFFDGCHAAGPSGCAFYASDPASISTNLTALYNSVRAQPVPAYTSTSTKYGLVDYATLKNAVFTSLYTPYSSFVPLSQGLADLAQGNGSLIFQIAQPQTSETVVAITCADGAPVSDGPAELKDYFARISNISSFSGIVAGIRVQCSGWRLHPQHFSGPISGNTSFPLLVIGNTADPVTPLANANKTAQAFPGAVLLTQDSPGHTSFSTQSECTLGFVQQYFQNGTMPPAGTICPVTASLFPSVSNTTLTQSNVTSRAVVNAQVPVVNLLRGLNNLFKGIL